MYYMILVIVTHVEATQQRRAMTCTPIIVEYASKCMQVHAKNWRRGHARALILHRQHAAIFRVHGFVDK